MKFLSRLFAANRNVSLVSVIERDRLSRTMPGQTGAVQAARLGILV